MFIHPQATTGMLMTGNKAGSNAGDWQIRITNTTLDFFYDNATTLSVASAVVPGTWMTLIVRLSAGGAEVFRDGVLKGSNATAGNVGGNEQAIRVGLQTNGGEPYKFLLSAVGITNTAVTADEQAAIEAYLAAEYADITFTNLS